MQNYVHLWAHVKFGFLIICTCELWNNFPHQGVKHREKEHTQLKWHGFHYFTRHFEGKSFVAHSLQYSIDWKCIFQMMFVTVYWNQMESSKRCHEIQIDERWYKNVKLVFMCSWIYNAPTIQCCKLQHKYRCTIIHIWVDKVSIGLSSMFQTTFQTYKKKQHFCSSLALSRALFCSNHFYHSFLSFFEIAEVSNQMSYQNDCFIAE